MASIIRNPRETLNSAYTSTSTVARAALEGGEILARVITTAALLYAVAFALGFSISQNGFFLDILVPGREYDQLLVLGLLGWGISGLGTDMYRGFGISVVSTLLLAIGQKFFPRSVGVAGF